MKKILYIDMDGVLVDFQSGIEKLSDEMRKQYDGKYDTVPGIFALMQPMPGAIDAFQKLSQAYDTYILTTSPWRNTTAPSEKLEWVKKFLGAPAYKRLIISHHKELNKGDYLIDDRSDKNGSDKFEGELIHFGSPQFPNWDAVLQYLLKNGTNN